MDRRLVAVLNCFSPTGANVSQIAVYSDGATKIFGDGSLVMLPLNALRALTPTAMCAPSLLSRSRPGRAGELPAQEQAA
jgi:hypothetical protein